ncbi:MAG: TonB-dependent receptor [Nitrosomonadales bacterium]|nr:TonB-dependent receptor [Nitrosomonadales bacterium]
MFSGFPVFTACYAGDDVSEQSYLQDFPVVLSASRLSQPLPETPNAVTVIDRDMIRASGFRNIADLFRMVPGMYVDYRDGYSPFVSYRGGTDDYTRRMQVLVDGRSVYLPPYNTVDWEDLPLHMDDIERIEVVRGPAAPSYGSNSVLGVINIITRDASALDGASIFVTRGNAGGGNGASDAVVRYGRSGERLDYRLMLGAKSDNGFNFPAPYKNWYNGYNDSSHTYMANMRGNYHPGGQDSFDLQLGFSDGTHATGDPGNYHAPPHDIKNNSNFQQLTWLRTLGQQEDFRLHYSHTHRNSVDERYTNDGLYWLTDNVSVHRHEIELQHTTQLGSANRFAWGAAMREESADAPTLFLAPQKLHQSRLFANDEWRISPRLLLNIGAMLESNGMGRKDVSPRVAVNYHVTPEQTFRAGISVAHRNPALFEERSNNRYTATLEQYFLSSGGLRPERALSREIGYLGEFRSGLSIDVRAYNDQVSNLIFADPFVYPWSVNKMPSYDFRNEFMVHYTGLEGTVKYSWDAKKNRLIFNFAHQVAGATLFGTPKIMTQAPALPPPLWGIVQGIGLAQIQSIARDFSASAPMNSFSILYSRQVWERCSASLGYYQQGAVYILTGDRQPLSRRLDVRIAEQFGPAGKVGGGEVSLVVQNALKDSSVGYSGYLFDRRAYLAATLNF